MIENIYCERSLGVVRSIYFRVARPGIGNSRQTLVAAVAIAQRYRSPPTSFFFLQVATLSLPYVRRYFKSKLKI